MTIKTTLAIQVPIAAGVFHGGLFGDGNGDVCIGTGMALGISFSGSWLVISTKRV